MSDISRLSSLSTRTLVQVIERKRLSSYPGAPLPTSQLSQITRSLETLREGIVNIENQGSEHSQTTASLRQQWDRMRDMLGDEGRTIPELEPPPQFSRSPSPPPKTSLFSDHDPVYTPYRDHDPQLAQSESNDISPPELLQTQRHMMDDQDAQLDVLAASIHRQREISIHIGSELEVHEGLLEDLDHGLDRTNDRLSGARRRLDRVGRGAKDNASAVTIGLLIFILLILIVVFKT